MSARSNRRTPKPFTLGLWSLIVALLLSACSSSGEVTDAPVKPDPERPTFIMFFTDP